MPRIARLVVKGEPAVYHIISRTTLVGFVMEDMEKEYLLNLIKMLSQVYFVEVLGFCLLGNHFHLLVRMHPGEEYDDEEIKRRFYVRYGETAKVTIEDDQVPFFRMKWEKLSEYVKDIKQIFSRYYNREHDKKGYFWSDRFKSVLVENGDTLINCLAYIDLNPVRAGIVEKPEEYRWSSLGYHVQRNNQRDFLSLDFGLMEFGIKDARERLRFYREFVYEKGKIRGIEKERERDFELSQIDRFRYRTRYFTDSGIIGSKAFVDKYYRRFKTHFFSKHEKRPRAIKGLEGIFSLKRLSEAN